MRLHAVDELPFHQHPTPFNAVATSDPHFNDGYFFAFYAAEWYFVVVFRLHPNANAVDGGVAVAHADEQRCVRFSRALRPRYDDLEAGPFRLEIVEPLQRLRLTLDDNPADLKLDVTFTAQSPPFVEERYQHFKYGAVVNDTIRYTQICRASGTAQVAGADLEIDRWHAMRDHSWGVRSSMGPPNVIGGTDRTEAEADRRAIRLWVPFEAGDHCGFFQTHEDATGETLDFEGRLDYPDGRSIELRSVTHSLSYEPGTVRPVGGSFDLVGTDDVDRHYELKASGPPADVQGLGYYRGWSDGKSAGVYRGPETVEHDAYPTKAGNDPTGPPHVLAERRLGPTEYPCFLTGPDGGEGMAHLEHHVYGRYDPYSFT